MLPDWKGILSIIYDKYFRALERERSLSSHLQQNLDAEKTNSERLNGRDAATIEDLILQLDTERANLEDLNTALQREQAAKKEMETEKTLLKDHLHQERILNEELKQDLDRVQVKYWIEKLGKYFNKLSFLDFSALSLHKFLVNVRFKVKQFWHAYTN